MLRSVYRKQPTSYSMMKRQSFPPKVKYKKKNYVYLYSIAYYKLSGYSHSSAETEGPITATVLGRDWNSADLGFL